MNRHSDGDQRVKRKRGRGRDRPHLQAIVGGVNGAVRSVINHTCTSCRSHLSILEDKILYKGKCFIIVKILKKTHLKTFYLTN